MTFTARQRSREEADAALIELTDDLAPVFEPLRRPASQTLVSLAPPLPTIMRTAHPFATAETLQLNERLQYEHAPPSIGAGVGALLDIAAARKPARLSPDATSEDPHVPTSHVAFGGGITCDVAAPPMMNRLRKRKLVAVAQDTRGVVAGIPFRGKLRGRALPVAAARFADQLPQSRQPPLTNGS